MSHSSSCRPHTVAQHSILRQTYAVLWTGNVLNPADLISLVRVLRKIVEQVDERHEFVGNWLYCLRNATKLPPAAVQRKRRTRRNSDRGNSPNKTNARSHEAPGPSGNEHEGHSQSVGQSAGDQDTGLPTTLNLLRTLPSVDLSIFMQSWASGDDYPMTDSRMLV